MLWTGARGAGRNNPLGPLDGMGGGVGRKVPVGSAGLLRGARGPRKQCRGGIKVLIRFNSRFLSKSAPPKGWADFLNVVMVYCEWMSPQETFTFHMVPLVKLGPRLAGGGSSSALVPQRT